MNSRSVFRAPLRWRKRQISNVVSNHRMKPVGGLFAQKLLCSPRMTADELSKIMALNFRTADELSKIMALNFRTADELSKIMAFFYFGAAKPSCLSIESNEEAIPSVQMTSEQ